MYLLDTHTLIWAITDDDKLSDKAKGIILSKLNIEPNHLDLIEQLPDIHSRLSPDTKTLANAGAFDF